MQHLRPHCRPTESESAFLTRPPGNLYVHLNLRSNGLGDLMEVKIFALRILTIILGELSGSEVSNFFFFSCKESGSKYIGFESHTFYIITTEPYSCSTKVIRDTTQAGECGCWEWLCSNKTIYKKQAVKESLDLEKKTTVSKALAESSNFRENKTEL